MAGAAVAGRSNRVQGKDPLIAANDVAARRRETATISAVSLTVAALVAAILVGVIVVFRISDADRDRDLRQWSERLGIVADTRVSEVNGWIEAQYGELSAIAGNASVQLYMTELAAVAASPSPSPQRVTEALAQSGYLRNLLTVVADRAGFVSPLHGPEVDANVDRVAVSGIAVLDASGRVIVATRGMPPLAGQTYAALTAPPEGGRGFLDIRRTASGELVIGFSVPVFAVQGDGTRPIGRIVGIREVADALYPRLAQPGFTWETAEIYLVRRVGRTVEFLSPRRGGRAPLNAALSAEAAELAAAQALRDGSVFRMARDYAGADVLFAARAVTAAPWSLVVKVDSAEALAEGTSRRTTMVAALLSALALVFVGFIAVWRHGTSLRASRAAHMFQDLARRYEAQSRFLRLVADSQPSPMFIVDTDGRFRFANRAAAERAAIEDRDMIGKPLASVLGTAEAERYATVNRDVQEIGAPVSRIHRSGANGDLRVVQAEHIPVADGPDFDRGFLIVEQDITAAVSERERRETALRQLVRGLVRVMDRRDPYAADHSARVAVVARAIAEEMGLDERTVETAETAGILLNVGKLFVPTDLLTRPGALNEDERREVRACIDSGADLLADVPFDGPVVETMRSVTERWDGTGHPRGLAGTEILVSARIVAVANAFVAMSSARSWRPGADYDQTAEALLAESGRAFDRAAVVALINRMENREGRAELMSAQASTLPL